MGNNNREIAKTLFVDGGWTQKRIATHLGVTEQTISSWANKKDEGLTWVEARHRKLLTRKTLIERNIALLDYELTVNQKFIQLQTENETYEPLPSGNVDKLIKLMSTLKLPEVTPGYAIQVISEFIEYIQNHDLDLAKRVLPHSDKYVVELAKKQ